MCLHWKIAGKSKLNLMVIVVCLLLCGTLILPITSDTYSHIRNSNSNTVDTGLCICDCSLVRWCVFPYHRMDSSYLRDSKRYTVISPFKNWKKWKSISCNGFLPTIHFVGAHTSINCLWYLSGRQWYSNRSGFVHFWEIQ